MRLLLRTSLACFLWAGGMANADVAVVLDAYYPTIGLEEVSVTSDVDQLNAWQYVHYHLMKRGENLILNNLGTDEVHRLLDPAITTVIFNNPPWWATKNLKKFLQPIHAKKILVCWEPPTVLPDMYKDQVLRLFDVVLTWNPTLQKNERTLPFYYPSLRPLQTPLKPFSERRLLTQISRNKYFSGPHELYTLRKSVHDYFESHPELDYTFYGLWWDGAAYKNYGGTVGDKIATLQNYKFSICFENTKGTPGYVSEKIFDCLAAGCVPIYYGAPDIAEYVPKGCYIPWEEFHSIEKVYDHIKNMTEEAYLKYIENIRAFLASEGAQRFTNKNLGKAVLKALDCPVERTEPRNAAARKT